MPDRPDKLPEIKQRLAVIQSAPANWYIEGLLPRLDAMRETPADLAWLIAEVERLRAALGAIVRREQSLHPCQCKPDGCGECSEDIAIYALRADQT